MRIGWHRWSYQIHRRRLWCVHRRCISRLEWWISVCKTHIPLHSSGCVHLPCQQVNSSLGWKSALLLFWCLHGHCLLAACWSTKKLTNSRRESKKKPNNGICVIDAFQSYGYWNVHPWFKRQHHNSPCVPLHILCPKETIHCWWDPIRLERSL